jgi:hypothetical protein
MPTFAADADSKPEAARLFLNIEEIIELFLTNTKKN